MTNSPLMSLALTGGGWVIWMLALSSIGAVAVAYDRWKLLKEESAREHLGRSLLDVLDGHFVASPSVIE